jgi:BirA family biotin operon repressor/biotin-[acetyl-CoA-carboxylase] ligase
VPGRSLACSVVLRPDLPPEGEGLLWLLASVAAAEGVERASGLEVRLKWPDDLVVAGRRVGAVAVSARLGPGGVEAAVITMRVNVGLRVEDLPVGATAPATSLALEGAPVSRPVVLGAFLERLEIRYRARVVDLLTAYRVRCGTLGRRVRVQLVPGGEVVGRAADVDERGALVVEGAGPLPVQRVRRVEVR